MSHVIGCDLGSQSVKAVVVDGDGRQVGLGSAPLDLIHEHPGWAGQDPHAWLGAIEQAVRQARESAGIAPADIDAIGFASQVDGTVAVDAANRPLANAIIWMDRRATAETEELGERIGTDRLFTLTGLNLDASHTAPKIVWLRRHDEDAARADAFLAPGAFVVAHLTGERVSDYANASSTLLYDVNARDWSGELLEAAGIDAALLGRVAPSTDIAGTLRPEVAEALGLTPACRVIVGTGDEHGATLGAGVLDSRAICDITGTAEPVTTASDRPVFDDTRLVETHGHADPRAWLIENPGFVSGGSTRWLAEVLETTQDALPALAERAPAGSDGVRFVPALSGAMTPRWNSYARGAFSGLALSHGRPHLARAVFEGCCFALRDIVDRFAEIGLDADELRVVGGGARSGFWLQMKADVTGRTVRLVETEEATAIGAAMLAATGQGSMPSLDAAAEAMVRLSSHVLEPNRELGPVYDEAYRAYRGLFDAVETTW